MIRLLRLEDHPREGALLHVTRPRASTGSDHCSFGCGHKARKLGYLLADAVGRRATVLVSAASLPSSQAVGLAGHAGRVGLRAHIVYCGDEQQRPTDLRGNYLLVALLGATVTWYERSAWDAWPSYVQTVQDQERARGERPYLAPPGLSAWPGLLGSIDLGLELAAQLPDSKSPVHVVAAAGSGGTCLGIAIVAHALSLPWTVHGVCIGGPIEGTARELADLRHQATTTLGSSIVPVSAVRLHDGARGAGYDKPQPAEMEVMRDAFARYQLSLDPVYMAKTFLGMQQIIDRGDIPSSSRVLLVHTGGSLGIFNRSPAMEAWASTTLARYLAKP